MTESEETHNTEEGTLQTSTSSATPSTPLSPVVVISPKISSSTTTSKKPFKQTLSQET